jgi:ABC-type phosphate transport system substrate-binding protein
VNGVFPDESSVRGGTYPFISKVHVAIRSDLDRGSMAYKLYEWLLSENAHSTIAECGFLPLLPD